MSEFLETHKNYNDNLVEILEFNPDSRYDTFIKNYKGNMTKECEANFVVSYYFLNKYVNTPEEEITDTINIAKSALVETMEKILLILKSFNDE
jgi:hypothetical protein